MNSTYFAEDYHDDNNEDYYDDNYTMGDSSQEELVPAEEVLFVDWTLLEFVALCITIVFMVLSLVLNLSCIGTVAKLGILRTNSYFQIHVIFSTLHIVYFILAFLSRAIHVLGHFELLPESIGILLAHHSWLFQGLKDLLSCLLGLLLLLLCVMTMEHRMIMSRDYLHKQKRQTCLRTFFTIMAFVLALGTLAVISLIRHTTLLVGHEWDWDEDILLAGLINYSIYLLLFTILPAFVIVICGVVNCVTAWNSTRPLTIDQMLTKRLDLRHGLTATPLIAVTIVLFIISMAEEIDAYENVNTILTLTTYSLTRAQDLLLTVFPISTAVVLGKRCCCNCCCCQCCKPPPSY